jgi:OOP family OmpA-OmpF porin
MTFKNLLIMSASVIALIPAAAIAEMDGNWYAGLGAGAAFEHDASFTRGVARNSVDFDWGWGAEGALGYRYDNGFRTELEIAYRGNNDVDSISGTTTPNGDSSSWAAMANVLYDIDMFDNTRFMPYIGVGAGVIKSNYDNVGPALGLSTRIDDSSFDFGYQAMAGLTYKATDMLDLYAQYKYTSAINPDYDAIAVTNVDGDYDVSTIMAGVRFNFGAPATAPVAMAEPAPEPAPVSQTSRSYIVFFDFNRSDLTPEAREIIRQAAADAKAGNAINMDVRGHADRSGSDMYNQKLSERRAEAVRAELASNGVNINSVGTAALGEREPLVPTKDGMKEPQNRRAEIFYNK